MSFVDRSSALTGDIEQLLKLSSAVEVVIPAGDAEGRYVDFGSG